MSLDERIGWLLLGCMIGFALGYIVRSLREIKEEIQEVDKTVKRARNEEGFMRNPIVADVALLLVIVLTVWAAFASQKASNDIQDTQDRIARVTICNQQYLSKTIRALNDRTEKFGFQAQANLELQKAQAAMLSVLTAKPPKAAKEKRKAFEDYFDALNEFVSTSAEYQAEAVATPYPTNEELGTCLRPE